MRLAPHDILPSDVASGTFIGRVWLDGPDPGPRPVVLRDSELSDLSGLAPTVSDLFELPHLVEQIHSHPGARLCSLEQALRNGNLLAPCDLQAIKACGVTFASSLLERMIEEKARGNPDEAKAHRAVLEQQIGGTLASLSPGSLAAESLKKSMIHNETWSQYLEVGIGPDPEIFTKAQPMSAVGCGASIGLRPGSGWSVSEPELVLAVGSNGQTVGASLGNDLTLRDFESRSALLLGQAKDNNASCAIGPFVRLFDEEFTLDDVRQATVELQIKGEDLFEDHGANVMSAISRDPEDLVAATIGKVHQYPDGMMLFLGTMFVPDKDRDGPGSGFTHKPGDRVDVSSALLGTLANEIVYSDQAPPWIFGTRALARSLAARGVL